MASVSITNEAADQTVEIDSTSSALKVLDVAVNSLVPGSFDCVSLSYTIGNLTTARFKTGGFDGTLVATLVMTYDVDNNLETVIRT